MHHPNLKLFIYLFFLGGGEALLPLTQFYVCFSQLFVLSFCICGLCIANKVAKHP